MPISGPRLGAGPDDTVRFTVNLVELRRAFRRILARLPDEAEAGSDFVVFTAKNDTLEIAVGGTSEITAAKVEFAGRVTVPHSVFLGVGRAIRFHRGPAIVVSFAAGRLKINQAEYRHPRIALLTLCSEAP